MLASKIFGHDGKVGLPKSHCVLKSCADTTGSTCEVEYYESVGQSFSFE